MPGRHDKIDYWDSVYGLDFSPIKTIAMAEPLVDYVEPDQAGCCPRSPPAVMLRCRCCSSGRSRDTLLIT